MKVYLAAMYSLRETTARDYAQILVDMGHEVTSRWLVEDEPPGSETVSAIKDLSDVHRADALVLITNPFGTKYTGGGRHVEMGYALALRRHVVCVGDFETIFQHLPQVPVFDTIEKAAAYLSLLTLPRSAVAMLNWCVKTFGSVALQRIERAARLLEEAVELVQVEGVSSDVALRIVNRTYQRPPGELRQEVGQVANLLECLAQNVGLDVFEEGQREFDRCQAVPQVEWDRRHAAKVAVKISELNR